MMEWIPCTECIYVNEDCVEARRADGCYYGEREEWLEGNLMSKEHNLVEHLNKYENCKNCSHLNACDTWVRNASRLYDDYTYSVENCPYYEAAAAADVEPVRHGKWEFIDYRDNGENITATCSNCLTRGKVRTNRNCFGMWYIDSPRCPCCGAKMDKE